MWVAIKMVAIRGNEKERVEGRISMDKVRGKRSMELERGGKRESWFLCCQVGRVSEGGISLCARGAL